MSSRQRTSMILVGALIVLLAISQRPALQMVAALATCLLLPGLGWARKLRTGDRGDTLAMTLVISICATVGVSTTMAVSDRWSSFGGFTALALVTLAGFVPYRHLASRAGAVLPAPVAVKGERVAWIDWYDHARREAAAQRRSAEQAKADAAAQWRQWYAERPIAEEPANWDTDRIDVPEPVSAEPVSPELVTDPVHRAEPAESIEPIDVRPDDDDLVGVGADWTDWYAVARQRDDSSRRKAESADRHAGEAWRDWYRRASRDAPIHRD